MLGCVSNTHSTHRQHIPQHTSHATHAHWRTSYIRGRLSVLYSPSPPSSLSSPLFSSLLLSSNVSLLSRLSKWHRYPILSSWRTYACSPPPPPTPRSTCTARQFVNAVTRVAAAWVNVMSMRCWSSWATLHTTRGSRRKRSKASRKKRVREEGARRRASSV